MTYQGYTVVDTDAHYYDEFGDLVDYIDDDDPWKLRFREGIDREPTPSNLKLFPKVSGIHGDFNFEGEGPSAAMRSKQDVIDAMAEVHVDIALILSNRMLVFGLMTLEDRRQTVFAEAYTEFMLDRIADPDRGVYISVPIPYRDPPAAAELIDRVRNERAVVGGVFVTGRAEPPLGNRKYDPIYEAAQDAELPLLYHSGDAYGDQFYMKGFGNQLETHALGFVWDNMAQITSLVGQGTPVKFPELDFVFQEAGVFWVPQVMYRLDTGYFRQEWQAPMLDRPPSEYMQEFYYCTQPLEVPPSQTYLEYVFEMIGGPNRLMFATDYPHVDFDHPRSITDLRFLDDEGKAKILGENAREVFGV